MSKHEHIFITVLGAGNYQPTAYYMQDNPQHHYHTRFAPIASLSLMTERPDKVIVLLTEEAERKNWKGTDDKPGMERELKALGYKYETERIPAGFSQKELEEILDRVFKRIPDGATVHFDLTHSFRHLPMLVMLLLHYAKVIKNVKVGGIYYGAYEADGPKLQITCSECQKTIGELEMKPILNLAFFSELQDWTRAVARFVQAGDASMLAEILDEWDWKQRNMRKGPYPGMQQIREIRRCLLELTENIRTCRGLAIIDNSCGVKLNRALTNLHQQLQKQLMIFPAPLIPLLDLIKAKVQKFCTPQFVGNLIYAVEFCYEHGLTQQGYTLLREFLVCRILEDYFRSQTQNVNWVKSPEREVADALLGIISSNTLNQPSQWQRTAAQNTQLTQYMINTKAVSNLLSRRHELSRLLEARNDINHAGFRQNPRKSKNLQEELKELLDTLKTI